MGNKHLWNIIQAINCGQWVGGTEAKFHPVMIEYLCTEYEKRKKTGEYSKKKVKSIKKRNKQWKRKKEVNDWFAQARKRDTTISEAPYGEIDGLLTL